MNLRWITTYTLGQSDRLIGFFDMFMTIDPDARSAMPADGGSGRETYFMVLRKFTL